MTPPGTSGRLAGLDGLRALAVSLVVVHHAGFVSGFTGDRWAGRFVARADVGVVVFFVLSGYLVAGPFVRSLLSGDASPATSRFLRRRAVRILPAYWLALIVMLVAGVIAVDGLSGFAWSASLLHVYDPDRFLDGIFQSWSLAAELVFYVLLVPAAAGARRLVARTASIDRRAHVLLAVCAAIYLSSLAFRIALHAMDPSWATTSTAWFPALADHFALGIAIAVVRAWADQRPSVDRVIARIGSRTARWWLGAVVAYMTVSTQLDLAVGFEVVSFGRELLRQLLYGVVGLCLVAPVALAPHGRDGLRTLLDLRPVAFLGRISYGVYLWHVACLTWILQWTGWEEFDANFPALLAGAFGLSVVAAAASYRLVEAPLLARFATASARTPRRAASTPPAGATRDP